MLLDYLEQTNQLKNSYIYETFNSLRLTIKPNMSMLDFFPKFFDELKTLSKRDTFELFFEIEGTHETVSNCSIDSFEKMEKHIAEFSNDSEYELELKINKNNVDKSVSIYFVDQFSDYLTSISLLDVINLISINFEESLVFEVFSKIKKFGSKTIQFTESGKDETDLNSFELLNVRQNKLSLLFENATTSNFAIDLLPDDFYLITKSSYEKINKIFIDISSLLSIVFISNSSSFEKDGSFLYKISGYKTISESLTTIDYKTSTCDILYKIYAWSYEGGNSSDKIGLVRNVLSIHLDSNDRVKIDNEVWQAIQSNYQIYLKDNVQSYLEIKNKIGEFVIESSARTYSMADEILSSFKNSIFVFVTFFLTVVVVNGLKDTGGESIFSDVYLAIVIILCIISLVWRKMTIKQVLKQFESASATVKQILKLNYSKVLMQSEIDECIDPVVSTNRIYLKEQVDSYSRWWLGIILVFGFSFASANIYFEHTDSFINKLKDELPIDSDESKVIDD
ncbi:hypothetical protein EHLJMEHL_01655 [Vreelandella titanicae]